MELAEKGRVPFFYVTLLLLAVGGILFASSCARNAPNRPEAEMVAPGQETSVSRSARLPGEGTTFVKDGRKYARQSLDDVEFELERAQTENTLLREENNWLRTEVNRLQLSLADANQTIYSLTRKLDAIFNPDVREK